MNDGLEIEIKFFLSDICAIRDRILALGANFLGKHFETNTCFENETFSLKARDMLLRLRKDDKTRLTVKTRPPGTDKEFKVYREMEVEVNDFDTCQAILENLGFHPHQSYEKWRETFLLKQTKLLLDTTPYGVFLEIEGLKPDISDLANRLNLNWKKRILLNYLAIFEIIRHEENLSFRDMTFDNFRGQPVNVKKYLHLLYPE